MIRPMNDDGVSEAAVEFELKRLLQFYSQHMPEKQIKANMESFRRQAREQAVGVRLLIREARRQNIAVDEEEVEDVLQQIVEQAGGDDAFLAMLEQQDITEELLRESLKDSKRVDKLIRNITADVPRPTEKELRAYYDAHIADFERPERRRAQHILIKPAPGDPDGKKTAMAQLQGIRDAHAAGTDFAELAAAHSECPSGKKAGGSIGWVVRGALTPVFDAAVFSTEIGATSDVIETSLGLHIVLASAAEAGETESFTEAKERICELLLHGRRGKAISSYLKTLKP